MPRDIVCWLNFRSASKTSAVEFYRRQRSEPRSGAYLELFEKIDP